MTRAQLKGMHSTLRAVVHQCLQSGHATMVYQIHQHGHIINAVVAHLTCH